MTDKPAAPFRLAHEWSQRLTPVREWVVAEESSFIPYTEWPALPPQSSLKEIFVTVDPETHVRSSILINSNGTVVGGCWSSDWPDTD